MATWAICAAGALYCMTAYDFAINKGDWAMGWAWLCYAGANVGFAIVALRT